MNQDNAKQLSTSATNPQSMGMVMLENGDNLAERELLVFTLAAEEYAIDILRVQEIRGYGSVTPIVNAPEFIKGVINLRGTVVPIVDLRIKFGLGSPKYNSMTVVIILKIEERTVGVVVDSVSDVLRLQADQLRPAPEFNGLVDADFIIGLGTVDERMLIMLDIARLIKSRDMALFDSVEEAAAEAAVTQ